jgi:protein phosphatase
VGRVRSANQDEVREFARDSGVRLLVVADGMGGHAGGEVASATCVEAMGDYFARADEDPAAMLRHAFEAANECFYRKGNEEPGLFGMGTTAVAALVEGPDRAWVAHVGDSRAYRLHDGRLEQLTDDHSWVQEQVRLGRLTPEEAEVHPRRNALMRSIGIDSRVEVDVRSVDLRPENQLLLCSDGLWGELDDQTISSVLASARPEESVRRLVELANEAGGHDNVTVAVLALPASEGPSAQANRTPDPRPAGLHKLGLAVAVALGVALLAWLALGR